MCEEFIRMDYAGVLGYNGLFLTFCSKLLDTHCNIK